MAAITDAWTQQARGARHQHRRPARGHLPHGPAAAGRHAARRRAHRRAPCRRSATTFDAEWGGFGAAPKFPSTMSLDLLLRLVPAIGRRPARGRSSRRRSTRWRRAACTTTSAAASPATRSTASGSSRTSRRCSTTRRCWCGCTPTPPSPSTSRAGARSWPRPSSTCCATCASPAAGSRRPRTPTPPARTGTATRACSTRGPSTRSRDVLGDDGRPPRSSSGASAPDGNFEGRSIPNRLHARGQLARPPAIEDARRRLFEARQQRPAPGPRRQGAHRVERAR